MYQKKGLPHTGSSLLRHYTCIIAGSLGWWMLDGRAVANFVWLVYRGKIQTEDNLRRKHGKGSGPCQLCLEEESMDHLLFKYPLAMFLCGRWIRDAMKWGLIP
jgi:hypothetical protein